MLGFYLREAIVGMEDSKTQRMKEQSTYFSTLTDGGLLLRLTYRKEHLCGMLNDSSDTITSPEQHSNNDLARW